MKILHISDTHSNFYDLNAENCDLIVHSGDWLPNKTRGNRQTEPAFQEEWLKYYRHEIKAWVKGKKVLFCQGNHDFINPKKQEDLLRDAGIDAIDITNKYYTFNGFRFYGFPHIPYINGEWNYERTSQEMYDLVFELSKEINKSNIDVLVAHSPPANILDLGRGNNHYGSSHIANAIFYNWKMTPKAYLCGHVHEAASVITIRDIIFSNAACTQNIIEL